MFEESSGVVAGAWIGGMSGFASRSFFGDRANPCRTKDGSLWYVGGVTGVWWSLSYPGGRPGEAGLVVGFGFGYLLGYGVRVIVDTIRRGFGDEGGGGWGGGGGGGGWEPPEPWGPGPTDFTGERPPIVVEAERSRGLHDLMTELASAPPAPAEPEPALYPVGR